MLNKGTYRRVKNRVVLGFLFCLIFLLFFCFFFLIFAHAKPSCFLYLDCIHCCWAEFSLFSEKIVFSAQEAYAMFHKIVMWKQKCNQAYYLLSYQRSVLGIFLWRLLNFCPLLLMPSCVWGTAPAVPAVVCICVRMEKQSAALRRGTWECWWTTG